MFMYNTHLLCGSGRFAFVLEGDNQLGLLMLELNQFTSKYVFFFCLVNQEGSENNGLFINRGEEKENFHVIGTADPCCMSYC